MTCVDKKILSTGYRTQITRYIILSKTLASAGASCLAPIYDISVPFILACGQITQSIASGIFSANIYLHLFWYCKLASISAHNLINFVPNVAKFIKVTRIVACKICNIFSLASDFNVIMFAIILLKAHLHQKCKSKENAK
jgi:hypothetical protein